MLITNSKVTLAALMCAAFVLAACGGGGGGGGGGSPPPPPPGNQAPVWTSAGAATVAENTAGSFYTATASDPNGNALTFSVAAGADAARFAINASTGALSFAAPPDFEAPTDANGDNIYQVTLSASDGALSATLALTVTVTNAPGAIAVRRVGTGFASPLFAAGRGDGSGRIFVIEKGGLIRILNPATGAIAATPFLNVSTQVSTANERGLLGMALAPDFSTTGAFYVYLTNASGAVEVRRYRTLAGNPDQADASSADVILTFPHSAGNHNGGWIGFGSDDLLYIASGDNANGANAQVLTNFYGKILRIDPSSDGFPGDSNRDYAIPAGNPFSAPSAPEVLHYGLRNPFRASFDRANGALFIGDVGENSLEEINIATAGASGLNYGWPNFEGTTGGGSSAGVTMPIAQYGHGTGALQGNSVTGGYVYRGPIASLRGIYFFGDFVNRRIWSITAPTGQVVTIPSSQFVDRTASFTPNVGAIGNISSFGEDDSGNLLIVDFSDGEVFMVVETD